MSQLEGCIQFHESLVFHDRAWLSPATLALEENTIKFLKELLKIKEG